MSLEYLKQLISNQEEFTGGSPEGAYDRLDREREQLNAALGEAFSSDPELGLQVGFLLRNFWFTRGHLAEGREWLQRLLEAAGPEPSAARAKALTAAAGLAFRQGDNQEAKKQASDALDMATAEGWEDVQSLALLVLARAGLRDRDPDTVRNAAGRARELAKRRGDESDELSGLHCLAEAERMAGNLDLATELYKESLSRNRKRGWMDYVSTELTNFAYIHKTAGRLDEGEASAREAMAISESLNNRYLLAHNLVALGTVLAAKRRFSESAKVLGHADRIFAETGLVLDPADKPEYDEAMSATQAALGAERFALEYGQAAR